MGDQGNSFNLGQSVYVTNGEEKVMYWEIPISFSSVGGEYDDWENTAPTVWIPQDQPSIEVANVPGLSQDVPLILNVQATGYFRINYDDDNWRLIGESLANNKDVIHPLNRAQLICDVISLA